MASFNLKSTEEFITYYFNDIKNYMKNKNILIKHDGYIGYFIRLMGMMQSDIKNYYDYGVKESFPIHAQEQKNLNYHSKFYGFQSSLATPSQLKGNFIFNFNSLPIQSINTNKRLIIIEDSEFKINGFNFLLDSTYTISQLRKNTTEWISTSTISDSIGTKKYAINNNKLEIKEMFQYELEEVSFNAPVYSFGMFHKQNLGKITDNFISKIEVSIKENNSDVYESFDASFTKEFFQTTDKVIFVNLTTDDELIVELGNGINGKFIPLSNIKLSIYITNGNDGNIKNIQNTLINGRVVLIDYDINGVPLSSDNRTFQLNKFIDIDLIEAYGGKDVSTGEDLRLNLIKYVQSRDNIINEIDFYNELENEIIIIFKKTNFYDNSFIIYSLIRDNYDSIIKTLTTSVMYSEFKSNEEINDSTNEKYIYKPKFTINNNLFISPFIYVYDDFLNLYKGYVENKDKFIPNNIIISDLLNEPLNIFIELEYISSNIFRFWVRSYNDISNKIINITITRLAIHNQQALIYNDSFYLDYHGGVFFDNIDIEITIDTNVYVLSDVNFFLDVSDNILLKKHNDKIVNFPLLMDETFKTDETYYTNKIIDYYHDHGLNKTRMISDDIQMRLYNTYMINDFILKELTIQKLEMNLHLPLRLKINITVDYSINKELLSNLTENIDELQMYIIDILLNHYTGNKISFYKSKLHDYIHNIDWVKSCNIFIYDDLLTEIPNGNIETIDNKTFIREMPKAHIIDYSPPYFYWDINNIDISYNKG